MDLVTVQVRVGSLTGPLAGTFIVHARALQPGALVQAAGPVLKLQEVVWLGIATPGPLLVQAVAVVVP